MCIYCKHDSLTSKRQAHIASQGLIPSETCLPRGTECDDCNEYAGQLETAFIHHNRIWTVLMLASIPGKKGRPRKRLAHFVRNSDALSVDGRRVSKITFAPGSVDIQLPDPPEFDDLKFRRGLHHMAFNYLAWKKGVDYVLHSRFDPVRHYIRYAKRGEAWSYGQVMYPDDRPNKRLRLTLIESAPGCVVRFISYLDEFYVDLLKTGALHDWARRELPQGVLLL